MHPSSIPQAAAHSLPVMEKFYTIQGEGAHTGSAAYFIRLAGCDVGCVWCDVKDSWDGNKYPQESIDQLVTETQLSGAEMVVITGGEPTVYNLEELTSALQNAGLRTHIETSGAHVISGLWHWVCLSPKKFKQPIGDAHQQADELKIVVYNKSDFKWAETHADLVRKECLLYLQPEWDRTDAMLPLIIEYVKKNPRWKISLQSHKFMDIP